MTTSQKHTPSYRTPVMRSNGITTAERYLKKLCDHTFLSLWSYPGIYRDQGGGGVRGGHGKEICDLLVVFENDIIIFSDKDCKFPNTGNLESDWSRWFRRAVMKSAVQIWGAERWIKAHPDRLYLNRSCTQPFPIDVPDPNCARFHRIVVAHDVSKRCQQELGGTGSLMITPSLTGQMHCAKSDDGGAPFSVGQLDPTKGYVHILDDTSLEVVLNALDTITDFVKYLIKKEDLICSGRLIAAAGEDDLLAFYLKDINDNGEHDFVVPVEEEGIVIDEGFWDHFVRSPEHQAQLAANDVSYTWDRLIETFNSHILEGTQYYATQPDVKASEKLMRFLAKESRTRRRSLAKLLLGLIGQTPGSQRATRVILPLDQGNPYYVFLLLPHLGPVPDDEYREVRQRFLQACCMVTKLKFPDAKDIIGIATETGVDERRSEDALYYDTRHWTEKDEAEATRLQHDLNLLTDMRIFHGTEMEYPTASNQSTNSVA